MSYIHASSLLTKRISEYQITLLACFFIHGLTLYLLTTVVL